MIINNRESSLNLSQEGPVTHWLKSRSTVTHWGCDV
jgi:hypothetical protein